MDKPTEWPASVSTTFEPDKVIEVGEAEWTDLRRQGLLVDDGTEQPKVPSARSRRAGQHQEEE